MSEAKFEQWCIVELMGHQRIAGMVTEVTMFGSAMMRVDVPEVANRAAFTKFFGASSIYAVSPTTEEIARAVAEYTDHRPVERYMLPSLSPSVVRVTDDDGDAFSDDGDDDDDQAF